MFNQTIISNIFSTLYFLFHFFSFFFFQAEDGIRDWSVTGVQTCALPISIFHRLEVDLVTVGPGADVVEHLGGRVAVGNERGFQAMTLRHLEHVERPLGGDERLVVRRPDELRSLPQRQTNQIVGSDVCREHTRRLVAQRLTGEPVLAVPAVEIASQHAERERVRPWERMEERLLLGGIALQRRDVAGWHVQRAVLVEADLADPTASGLDEAAVPAGEAAHRMVGKLLDQLPLADARVQRLGEGGRPAVRGGGGFVSEERDDAALRHGIRRLPPFLNIAGPRTQPPTRSAPGARS